MNLITRNWYTDDLADPFAKLLSWRHTTRPTVSEVRYLVSARVKEQTNCCSNPEWVAEKLQLCNMPCASGVYTLSRSNCGDRLFFVKQPSHGRARRLIYRYRCSECTLVNTIAELVHIDHYVDHVAHLFVVCLLPLLPSLSRSSRSMNEGSRPAQDAQAGSHQLTVYSNIDT